MSEKSQLARWSGHKKLESQLFLKSLNVKPESAEEAEKCGTSRLQKIHYRIYYAFNLSVVVEQLEGASPTHYNF